MLYKEINKCTNQILQVLIAEKRNEILDWIGVDADGMESLNCEYSKCTINLEE